jgi:hypothetical protein
LLSFQNQGLMNLTPCDRLRQPASHREVGCQNVSILQGALYP